MFVNCTKFAMLLTMFAFASHCQASTLEMTLSDVDVIYQGGDGIIYDTMAQAGGNQDAGEADEVSSATFVKDGSIQPVLTETSIDMRADLLIGNVPGVLPLNGAVQSISPSGFGFEWFSSTGHFLKIVLEKVDILLTSSVFKFTAEGTIESQNMPEGLNFEEFVTLDYTSTQPAVQQNSENETESATAKGNLVIEGIVSAVLVPEPASSLMVIAMAGVCIFAPRFGKK